MQIVLDASHFLIKIICDNVTFVVLGKLVQSEYPTIIRTLTSNMASNNCSSNLEYLSLVVQYKEKE